MKSLRWILLLAVCNIFAISIMGCQYHEHYYGEEQMIDEGVVTHERYIVE